MIRNVPAHRIAEAAALLANLRPMVPQSVADRIDRGEMRNSDLVRLRRISGCAHPETTDPRDDRVACLHCDAVLPEHRPASSTRCVCGGALTFCGDGDSCLTRLSRMYAPGFLPAPVPLEDVPMPDDAPDGWTPVREHADGSRTFRLTDDARRARVAERDAR